MESSKTPIPQKFVDTLQLDESSKSELLYALDSPSPTSIRHNPQKWKSSLKGVQIPWSQNGVYLSERPSFTFDPLFHAGAYYVQEASSMFIEYILDRHIDFRQKKLVLDLCAAPGGKSTLLLDKISDDSVLVANEIIHNRSLLLTDNLTKWGKGNIIVTNDEALAFANSDVRFDLILVDAPCSGEGMFRKHQHARSEWSAELVTKCALRQKDILNHIVNCLSENGFLLYSTCTFNAQENMNQVRWLTEEYSLKSVEVELPEAFGITKLKDNRVVGYQSYPHLCKGEGFFCSLLMNTKSESFAKAKKKKKKKHTHKPIKENHDFSKYFSLSEFETILVNDRHEVYLHSSSKSIQNLQVKTIQSGLHIGQLIREKFIPGHGLAMLQRDTIFPIINLNKDQAIQYLRGETFELKCEKKSFYLVRYDGLNLGWINHLGNRFNNLYPKALRILKKA